MFWLSFAVMITLSKSRLHKMQQLSPSNCDEGAT